MLSILEVARQTFLLQLRSKLYWLLMLASVGFACTFLFLPPNSERVPAYELFGMICSIAGFTLILPFIALYLSVHAVHGDLEDRTSVYVFTRPIHRAWVLLGKWLAVVLLGSLFAVVAVSALYAVVAFSGREWRGGEVPTMQTYGVFVLASVLSVLGYAAVGCLFAAFFRRPMLLAMFYIVLQEFASRMPAQAGIHSATVADGVRRFALRSLENPPREVREFLQGRMAGAHLELGDPLWALAKLVLVTLLLAIWIYSRREYDARPRE